MNVSGEQAEALAVQVLVRHGLHIVARNYRCRGGEIDIIANEGEVLVFVEVRLRRDAAFGGAAASITAAKRKRLTVAARHYLGSLGREPFCRFDAILFERLDSEDATWLRGIDM
jgi:putative endonuclease